MYSCWNLKFCAQMYIKEEGYFFSSLEEDDWLAERKSLSEESDCLRLGNRAIVPVHQQIYFRNQLCAQPCGGNFWGDSIGKLHDLLGGVTGLVGDTGLNCT